jgi:hypothetical protein
MIIVFIYPLNIVLDLLSSIERILIQLKKLLP